MTIWRLKIQLLLCCNKIGFVFVIEAGVEDPNFAYGLLMELTRAFLAYADNVRAQDSAAYAIQVRYNVRSWFIFTNYFLSHWRQNYAILNRYILKYVFKYMKCHCNNNCTISKWNFKQQCINSHPNLDGSFAVIKFLTSTLTSVCIPVLFITSVIKYFYLFV